MDIPIYDSVVRDQQYDPLDIIPFDLATFLASYRATTGVPGVPEEDKPRKAARRARRS